MAGLFAHGLDQTKRFALAFHRPGNAICKHKNKPSKFCGFGCCPERNGKFRQRGQLRGTPRSGVPESVPLWAFPCLFWSVSKTRPFFFPHGSKPVSPAAFLMSVFARELASVLAGPPRTSQTDFAKRIGMTIPKLNRILKGTIQCNRTRLDAILGGVAEGARARLVNAYLQDVASPLALGHLRGKAGADEWAKVEGGIRMSRKGKAAMLGLLNSSHVGHFEKLCILLAETLEIPIDR